MTVKDIILSKINSPAARKVYDIACNYFGEENVDIWTDERALNVYRRTADEKMIIGRSGYKYIQSVLGIDGNIAVRSVNAFNKLIENHRSFFRGITLLDDEFLNDSSLYHGLYGKILDYAGESFGALIIIHFPKVTVTNENDNSTDIRDLYAAFFVNSRGELVRLSPERFLMFSKSTFSTAEYTLGYIHSHTNLCDMDSFRFPSVFNTVCLGKGPIVSTYKLLNHEYNRAYYMLLMAQIKQVTEVESLNGGPYVRLDQLKYYNSDTLYSKEPFGYNTNVNPVLVKRISYNIIKDRALSFNYVNGSIGIAQSLTEQVIIVTKYLLKTLNELWREEGLTFVGKLTAKCYELNGNIYCCKPKNESQNNINEYKSGRKLFDFKGKEVLLNVPDIIGKVQYKKVVCNYIFVNVIQNIIDNINFHYDRKQTRSKVNSEFIRLQ